MMFLWVESTCLAFGGTYLLRLSLVVYSPTGKRDFLAHALRCVQHQSLDGVIDEISNALALRMPRCPKLKILDPIVIAWIFLVMHCLLCAQRSPKVFGHHETMLLDLSLVVGVGMAGEVEPSVASFIQPAGSIAVRSGLGTMA